MEGSKPVLGLLDIKNVDTFAIAEEESTYDTKLQLECPISQDMVNSEQDLRKQERLHPYFDIDAIEVKQELFESDLKNPVNEWHPSNIQNNMFIIKEESGLKSEETDLNYDKLSFEADTSHSGYVKTEHFDGKIRSKCSSRIQEEPQRRGSARKRPRTCSICEKNFISNNHLENHMRTHTGEKPFSCHICKKSFSMKANLKTHMITHIGDKPYSCDSCKKSFSQSGSLKKHMRIHTGEKPFSCDNCKKSFSQSGSLKKHMRIHTGEKPYSCDVCNKCFSEGGDMIRHIRTHSGEKPYSCDICQKSFSHSSTMKSHRKTHDSLDLV